MKHERVKLIMRVAPFNELKLSERAPDANLQKQHKEGVEALRKAWTTSFSIVALESFRSFGSTVQEHLENTGAALQMAAALGNVYDFGIVADDAIKLWEHRAEARPLAELPWDGPAVFLMTHPELTAFDKSVTVYLLQYLEDDRIDLTELVYSQTANSVIIWQTMVANLPFGASREVRVTACTNQPTVETVNSTLNPSIMGAAFVAETGIKPLS